MPVRIALLRSMVINGHRVTGADVRALEAACEARFGKPTEIIVKTERQWRALVAANPYRRHARKTPNRVLAWIMRSPVTARGLAQLRRRATKNEKIRRVAGGNFYIFFGNPNRDSTKIPAGFGLKALGAVGTNRTWTTVTAITKAVEEMKV